MVKGADHLPRAKLRSPVGVDHATGDVPAPGDGAVHGIDGETRFHSVADRVPDDPVAEDVLDCAEVELAFTGFVLRDVAEPEPVRCVGGELPAHKIVVHRRAGASSFPAAAFAERGPPAVVTADPPCRPLRHDLARVAGFVEEEPIAELRVVVVRVEQRVRTIRRDEFRIGDGVCRPPVAGLAGELERPARHRDGNTVSGELGHERIEPLVERAKALEYVSRSGGAHARRRRRRHGVAVVEARGV